jgi:hypothetical protein
MGVCTAKSAAGWTAPRDQGARRATRPPRRAVNRAGFVPLCVPGWFRHGGFRLNGATIQVSKRWAATRACRASDVLAVVLVMAPFRAPYYQVLLVNEDRRVILKDDGNWYAQDDLRQLAVAIGCDFRGERFKTPRALEIWYPGALTHPIFAEPLWLVATFTAAVTLASIVVSALLDRL